MVIVLISLVWCFCDAKIVSKVSVKRFKGVSLAFIGCLCGLVRVKEF